MILYTIRKGLRKGDKEANESKDHYKRNYVMKNYCSHFCMYPSYFLPITIYLSMLFEKTVLAEIVAEKDFYSGADCTVKTNYRHHGGFRPLPDGKDGCFFESQFGLLSIPK